MGRCLPSKPTRWSKSKVASIGDAVAGSTRESTLACLRTPLCFSSGVWSDLRFTSTVISSDRTSSSSVGTAASSSVPPSSAVGSTATTTFCLEPGSSFSSGFLVGLAGEGISLAIAFATTCLYKALLFSNILVN